MSWGYTVGAAGAPDPDAVTGLVPNLAARLQELAATGDVLVSDITASLIETAFDAGRSAQAPPEASQYAGVGSERCWTELSRDVSVDRR